MRARRSLLVSKVAVLAAALTVPVFAATTAGAAPTARVFNGSGSALLVRTGESTFALDGTAVVTGLGRTKFHEDGTFTAFEQWAATLTLTAANGDTVTLASVGGVVSETENTANIETQETVTGGTGRFAGAHGETTTTSQTVLTPQGIQINTFRFTGAISKHH